MSATGCSIHHIDCAMYPIGMTAHLLYIVSGDDIILMLFEDKPTDRHGCSIVQFLFDNKEIYTVFVLWRYDMDRIKSVGTCHIGGCAVSRTSNRWCESYAQETPHHLRRDWSNCVKMQYSSSVTVPHQVSRRPQESNFQPSETLLILTQKYKHVFKIWSWIMFLISCYLYESIISWFIVPDCSWFVVSVTG